MSPHESEKYSPVAVGASICANPVRFVTSSWNLGKSIRFSRTGGGSARRRVSGLSGPDVEFANVVAAGDRRALLGSSRKDLRHQRVDDRADLRIRGDGLSKRA